MAQARARAALFLDLLGVAAFLVQLLLVLFRASFALCGAFRFPRGAELRQRFLAPVAWVEADVTVVAGVSKTKAAVVPAVQRSEVTLDAGETDVEGKHASAPPSARGVHAVRASWSSVRRAYGK
jgi:hypothetical protein